MSVPPTDSAMQSINIDGEFKATLSSNLNASDSSTCPNKSPCKHASHSNTANFSRLLTAEHWVTQLWPNLSAELRNKTTNQQLWQQIDESIEDSLDVYQAHRLISEAFVKRLQEIEQKAPNALEPKLATYKDWVSVLQRLNSGLLNDFDELEKTIEQHLNLHECRSNHAFRHDVATLVKFIRQVYHHNNWNLAGFKFETLTPAELLGLNENDAIDRETLMELLDEKNTVRKSKSDPFKKDLQADSIKALADEVARRHDEISRLKREICGLEEEIKNAEKKLLMKDEYIRQLKNAEHNAEKSDIQEFPCKFCCSREMAPINMESLAEALQKENENRTNSATNRQTTKDSACELQSVTDSLMLQNKNPLGDMCNFNDLFIKLEFSRVEATKRVNNMRLELLKILVPLSKDNQQLSIQLSDEMLLQAVRERFDYICTLQEDLRREKDNIIKEQAEISGELIFLKKNKKSNEAALMQLSDLLTSMTGEVCSYEAIYDSDANLNPFCEAICKIKAQASDKIGDLKAQLQREKEKRERVEKEFLKLKNETASEKVRNINNRTAEQQENSSQNLTTTPSTSISSTENISTLPQT